MGGRETVARELTRLLEDPERMKSWSRHVRRRRRPGVHQGAVATVLAEHLWNSGEAPETDIGLPRRLKDVVSRALGGRGVSDRWLRRFIDAFDIGESDAARLWALQWGSSPARLLALGLPQDGVRPEASAPRTHETVSLHEVHTIGRDGMPEQHHTVQVIRAIEPMTTYEYRIDTPAAAVEIVRGGVPGPVSDAGVPGLFSCLITLSEPLEPGQTTALEYRTFFAYESPPPREFRRGARGTVTNMALDLQFHQDAVPSELEWCRWELPGDGEPTWVEPVRLSRDRRVHRFVDLMSGEIRGYRWR